MFLLGLRFGISVLCLFLHIVRAIPRSWVRGLDCVEFAFGNIVLRVLLPIFRAMAKIIGVALFSSGCAFVFFSRSEFLGET